MFGLSKSYDLAGDQAAALALARRVAEKTDNKKQMQANRCSIE
jgi:hypothetical protein